MDVKKAEFDRLVAECKMMVEGCGLKLPDNIYYTLNNRSKRRIGCCKRKYNNIIIEMSQNYFEEYLRVGDIEKIKDTLLHEMCHALPNGNSHGYIWKGYANKINAKYGFNIKRLADIDEVIKSEKMKNANYFICCKQCGKTTPKQRASKQIKYIELYRCGLCGGKLEVKQA